MNKFLTKGRTLEMLEHKLRCAKILPSCIFTIYEWSINKNSIKQKVFDLLGAGPWIVRSSFSGEDNSESSNAGAFASVLDVIYENLEEAVNTVIQSYSNQSVSEEILIQPMLQNVVVSGVAFSHDPNTASPDRIINWAEGFDTQAVTAGQAGQVWQIAAGCKKNTIKIKLLEPVYDLIDELLSIFKDVPIDCEFAIIKEKKDFSLMLLQVRPLVLTVRPKPIKKHLKQLKSIKEKIVIGMEPKPFITGKSTVYGIMPDWNPAEIIGRRPKPLAISLYQELITDSIWAYQRHNYGYRNLRSYPLMINLLGVPYIDVRVSFNSFVPSSLDDSLAGRLVDYYLEQLISQPNLHDKIEFEIVSSCYTFDLRTNLNDLTQYGFSQADQNCIAESLLNLTNAIIHPENGIWRKDADKLDILNAKFHIVKDSNLTNIEKIYWLVEDCKRYGTLPFAGLARAAFIGVQILRSLVNLGVLSIQNYQDFTESISTVSSQMLFDLKTNNKSDFLKKYGHLRPGTYDILSPRYDANPEYYFNWSKSSDNFISKNKMVFSLTKSQRKLINAMLLSNGLHTDADNLLDFIRSTIELREKAKFDFTRNLSEIISLIEIVGAKNNFNPEDLSYSNIGIFRELYLSASSSKKLLTQNIASGKARYKETLSLSLPPLILNPDDIFSFAWPRTDPNFITHKKVIAAVTTSTNKDVIADMILCIPSADPGYDWIFSYPIAGFITAWGGANSHMAIRAGEQQIPAVIGAGELLYQKWSSSKKLVLNCAEKRVEVIQ